MEALANLAHELRSPVQAIIGYLDILRDEMSEALGARHKQIIERLNANAHDLAQTVENVMDFSVADAMAEVADEEEIRLHDLIGDLAPALEAANDSKSLEIRFDLETAPTVFRSRRRPIKSILLNLALNAIKFTDRGSVTIAIRRAGSATRPGSSWKSATPDPESKQRWSSRHSKPALSFRNSASAVTAGWVLAWPSFSATSRRSAAELS